MTSPRSDPPPGGTPVDVGAAADPVAAFLAAHERGDLVALRTSGTTGRPRSVVRTTASWVDSFDTVAALTGLAAESRLWVPGPLAATMNLFAAVLARHVGVRLVEAAAEATHAHLTPLALERLLRDGVPLAGLHLTVAGDRLSPGLRDRALGAGARVAHYLGAAELSFVAWGTCESDLRAFPGVEVECREGVLWVRSPFTCTGYAGPPGPMRRDDRGFVSVGDRGELIDGMVRVLGRGEEAILTGAATVQVADVEAVLREAVSGSVVVLGLPHAELGQVVSAVLTDPGDLADARTAARAGLAPEQRPRWWFHLADLPMTAAGKTDRATLRALITAPSAGPSAGATPQVRRLTTTTTTNTNTRPPGPPGPPS